MGYESNGNGNDDVYKTFEESRDKISAVSYSGCSRETLEAFKSSFSAPANKVDFGRIIEITIGDPNGKESSKSLKIIYVKDIPETKAETPKVMGCEFLSRDSSVGRNIKGMTVGETRRFQNDKKQEMILSIDKVELLPDHVILEILSFPMTHFKGCKSEAVEEFKTSFKAPANKVDFGRVVELIVGGNRSLNDGVRSLVGNVPEGERLRILYVKETVVKAPCPPDCMYISKGSKVGQSIMGLGSGEFNKFLDNDGQEVTVFVERVDLLSETTVQEILKGI